VRMREVAIDDVNRHEIERDAGRNRRYQGCLSGGIEGGGRAQQRMGSRSTTESGQ